MRINKFIAQATGMSRRAADTAITDGRVTVDGYPATAGMLVADSTIVTLDGKELERPQSVTTIMLNKPAGYVCSRKGQGSQTIYDLLPEFLHQLKPVGRLDKDSSGLLLLTSNGALAQELTHPSYEKIKEYLVVLNKPLTEAHETRINQDGVKLEDGISKFALAAEAKDRQIWRITMHEGRNRQIRRTFETLGYTVLGLHRTVFGPYVLKDLKLANYREI